MLNVDVFIVLLRYDAVAMSCDWQASYETNIDHKTNLRL